MSFIFAVFASQISLAGQSKEVFLSAKSKSFEAAKDDLLQKVFKQCRLDLGNGSEFEEMNLQRIGNYEYEKGSHRELDYCIRHRGYGENECYYKIVEDFTVSSTFRCSLN